MSVCFGQPLPHPTPMLGKRLGVQGGQGDCSMTCFLCLHSSPLHLLTARPMSPPLLVQAARIQAKRVWGAGNEGRATTTPYRAPASPSGPTGWHLRLQPFPCLGTHSPSSDLKESRPPTGWIGCQSPSWLSPPALSPPAQVRHRPCSRCVGRR